ncbi:MAG: hypothetical protein A2091_10985 [Desulfuromonadales bacterium GWD2_61_12]|nr:MAG: hypothetical protein A2005_10655 [Desulfuromonadales bacterium GWC2_61_20]OGR35184.1 MAG: hypothetical protein A2091_10985 [Desulfuromonadales bacterium GWD2_61_12]HAD04061.1 hypothetical protein [Desulfuromonas sp.]HBT83504.1 hypothetical protein [Desulfuromonas sp.]
MNSLKVKILGLMATILILTVSLEVWHHLDAQKSMLSQLAQENGRVLAEIVRSSVITNMANGQNPEVARILEKISAEKSIAGAKIFDETGRIMVSANGDEIGDLVQTSDLLAYRAQKTSFTDTHGHEDLFKTIIPIENAPACHRCHDAETKVLGVLAVHLSLSELGAMQAQARQTTILSALAMLAVLILAISGFVIFYVDSPIRRLVTSMTRVEEGDFAAAQLTIDSSDEMAQLSEKFNRMVGRLKQLMESTVNHERELAISQQKLAHHDEIFNMNITLEERLKEIEYLNISLEERIEEIEEASYKITDLASDLESKNTTLEQVVSRLSALYKMGLAINSTMEQDKLFDLLIRKTNATLKARIGYILLLDGERQSMRVGAVVGTPEEIDRQTRIPLKPGGVSYWVVENRQPVLLQNFDEAQDFTKMSRLGFLRETVICAPLIVKDEVIGTITIANRLDGGSFTPEDLELLTTIAAQASVAIKNAQLYEEQQSTYLSTVQALVSAVEASDAYTRGHSERVTRYSLALGRALELPHDALKRLEHAAVLHDIGKIGIDISLLHKKGQLSPEDFALLQQHPLIGVRILDPIVFLKGVREIIVQHHERYDGRGYPLGVGGIEILTEARILAVADTYDAMTSDRPYRSALSQEVALQEIRDHAGSQFDPHVAEAFLSLCARGELHT